MTNTNGSFPIYTDRSRIMEYKTCPRSRFWGYEFLRGVEITPGQVHTGGLSPKKWPVPLLTGVCVHEGTGEILEMYEGDRHLAHAVDHEMGVKAAIDLFNEEIAKRGLDVSANNELVLSEAISFTIAEQRALTEALLRAWVKVQLPELIERFKVLRVEREEEVTLTNIDGTYQLVLMARLDSLLLERESQTLHIASWKTAADWNELKGMEHARDDQGLSETLAMENTLAKEWARVARTTYVGEPKNALEAYLLTCPSPPVISGVFMTFLLKGKRLEDKSRGFKTTQSHLIRGWRIPGVTAESTQYAWSWDVPKIGKDGGEYMGNIGSTWKKFHVWEEFGGYPGGVRAWIDDIHAGKFQPQCGPALLKSFVNPDPFMRKERDVRSWARQNTAQEQRVWEASNLIRERMLAGAPEDEILELLDVHFPQTKKACVRYGGLCAFDGICHGGSEVWLNPMATGAYVLREPHHDPEKGGGM